MIVVVVNFVFVFVWMLSSTNTVVGASLGLGWHDGWGYLLPWLGDCLWGWGLSILAHCLSGCDDGFFRVLGHLEIEESSPETKLLTQSFKIISHRKFLNYSAQAYISISELNVFSMFRGGVQLASYLMFRWIPSRVEFHSCHRLWDSTQGKGNEIWV